VAETEADGADQNVRVGLIFRKNGLVLVNGVLWQTAGDAKIVTVTVFAIPGLAKTLGVGASFMKGAEASIAAVDLTCFFALEAVVVVEFVLICKFLLLDNYGLLLDGSHMLDLSMCTITFDNHIFYYIIALPFLR